VKINLFQDVVEGAQTTIHLAVAEEVEGVSGKYFWECKVLLLLSMMLISRSMDF
jgi:hypothetical protein